MTTLNRTIAAVAVSIIVGSSVASHTNNGYFDEAGLLPEARMAFSMSGDKNQSTNSGNEGNGTVEVTLNQYQHSLTFDFLCGFASIGVNVYKNGYRVMSTICSPKPGESFITDISQYGSGNYLIVFDSMEEEHKLWCKFTIKE